MKTILVPTDFSPNAKAALEYAIKFAEKENAKLILLNVYQISFMNSYVPYNEIAKEIHEAKKESHRKLKKLAAEYFQDTKIPFETKSEEGFTVDVILNMIDKYNIDLVIMGTRGASGLLGAIFGSNTAKVIAQANCPVIAVPEGEECRDIKKITYATDYKGSDMKGIVKIADIAKLLDAQVNVLHISEPSTSKEDEKGMMETFIKEVNKKVPYNNITFKVIKGSNIEESLEKYLENDSCDLLVMSTHHRDFFDKVFGKSITKRMSYHLRVPLMALHHKTKSAVTIYG